MMHSTVVWRWCRWVAAALALCWSTAASMGADWQVGVSSVVITPDEPLWLSGYSMRRAPAAGKIHDLHAKALAITDDADSTFVIVTLDLGSISTHITEAVAVQLKERWGFGRENFALNVSHTHAAPEVAAERMIFHPHLPPEENDKLTRYIDTFLIPRIVQAVELAMEDRQGATIHVSEAETDFAFNRRHPSGVDPDGVVDHQVPVMRIVGEDGATRAVMFTYACHCTTLSFQYYCGDFAGFAQEYVQEAYPGATALFLNGCSGDQNPQPRHGPNQLYLAQRHGRQLADAVQRALNGEERPVSGPLRVAFDHAMLELEPLPPVEQLREEAAGDPSHAQRKAAYLLQRIDAGEPIELIQPCPLHMVRFGDDLLMVFLGGETVVDYALRIKREFAGPFVWVAGYTDDVFAYLPSQRVRLEGGYEGLENIVHQLTPTPFRTTVEDRIIVAMFGLYEVVHRPEDLDLTAELPRIDPLEPDEALRGFKMMEGFQIELAAAEPLVVDPIAMAFDERGWMYVVEFMAYPSPDEQEPGRIILLKDTNNDGRYDERHVFVEGVPPAVAVTCYDGGIFVGTATGIDYYKDTTGDHKADVHIPYFTGFEARNIQSTLNSLQWGLDNRIHGTSSFSSGEVRSLLRPDDPPVQVRGYDFAFDPRTGELELTGGGGQYGMSFDDWGTRYVCSNSDHLQMIFYESRYAARNAAVPAPSMRRSIAVDGPQAEVFRISPVEPWRLVRTRLRVEGSVIGPVEGGGTASGYFTSATGITIYRGDAWPKHLRNTVYVGEPPSNIIHRKVLKADGVGYIGHRLDERSEFVASPDIWFRPVQFANAPDGTLYVADMYREVIEGPAFIPESIKQHLDFFSGRDRGRIYRIAPDGFQRRQSPRLHEADAAQLVATLEHDNGWHRDTASRLLFERQDSATIEPLRALVIQSAKPTAKLHALYALQGMNALRVEELLHALKDAHPRVREHAVRLSESLAAESAALRQALYAMTSDEDMRVRFQLAFTLGGWRGADRLEALAAILQRDPGDAWIRFAAFSSLSDDLGKVFVLLLADETLRHREEGARLLGEVALQVGRQRQPADITAVLTSISALSQDELSLKLSLTYRFCEGLNLRGEALRTTLSQAAAEAEPLLEELLDRARQTAADENQTVEARVQALRMMELDRFGDSGELLARMVDGRQSLPLQQAAVAALSRFDDAQVPHMLLKAWHGVGPSVQAAILDALMLRESRVDQLLTALEAGSFARSSVDPARVAQLCNHPNRTLRTRAETVFEFSRDSSRQEVVDRYEAALHLPGDAVRGREVFAEFCSSCHRLDGMGYEMGPPLGQIKERGAESIMIKVLDPNREINLQFIEYQVMTLDGDMLSGVIAAETPTSITLQRGGGDTQVILRQDIHEIQSTGMTVMPEGLEIGIDQQAMADLMAYLMSVE